MNPCSSYCLILTILVLQDIDTVLFLSKFQSLFSHYRLLINQDRLNSTLQISEFYLEWGRLEILYLDKMLVCT